MSDSSEDSGFEERSENDSVYATKQRKTPTYEGELSQVNVAACNPLARPGHCLEPDMLFGWRPKAHDLRGPILLDFSLENFHNENVLYYGFRPYDSFEMHEAYSRQRGYKLPASPMIQHSYSVLRENQPSVEHRPFTGMSPHRTECELEFSSYFEAGNLDKVVKLRGNEYELYIRADTNTRGHNQWFYFSVKNPRSSREVRFHIMNFSKRHSLYTQGLLPCVYSSRDSNKGWHRAGDGVKYSYSKLNRHQDNQREYYSLSFSVTVKSNDTVYLAYSLPYTYTKLLEFLKSTHSVYLSQSALSKTLSGIEVPMLTITDPSGAKKKELVIITGRVHPGETHSSFVMEGLINFLLGSSSEAAKLRIQYLFKIVPMLNPDGVIAGNSRCTLVGDDLNRQFSSPDDRFHPEIHNLKLLLRKLSKSRKMFANIDLHAHSKKKGSFVYSPHYPLHSKKYCRIRVIPKLFSEISEAFRYYSSKYRSEWEKRNTFRLVISREFHPVFSYTLETSSHGYINSERQTIPFSVLSLQNIGESLALALLEYTELAEEDKRYKEQNRNARLMKGKKGKIGCSSRKKRTISDIIRCIKEEEPREESDSGGSDTDQEETQEETRKRLKLRTNISRVLEDFDRILKSEPVAANRMCKNKGINDKPAKSSLIQFFSKNHKTDLFARRPLLNSSAYAAHSRLNSRLNPVDSSQTSTTNRFSTRSTKKRSNNHSDVEFRRTIFLDSLQQPWRRKRMAKS